MGVNHATCYVYSPKADETLIHGQCYGYVKYIFFSFYSFVFALDLKKGGVRVCGDAVLLIFGAVLR